MRRVVVTGLGMVTPLASGVEPTWAPARSRAQRRRPDRPVRRRPTCRPAMACEVPRGDGADGDVQSRPVDGRPRTSARSTTSSSTASPRPTQALTDAGWKPESYEDQIATGVLIGSGIGGLAASTRPRSRCTRRARAGSRRSSSPAALINLVSGQVSIPHGLKGPNHAVVTACSTGAHAIGDAARLIALGDADVMVAGGAESPVNRLRIAGFCACRALSTGFNDAPDAGLPPVRQGPRRLRHGRGRRLVVLEELRARQGPRRQDLRRGGRLRHVAATPTTSPRPRPTATAPFDQVAFFRTEPFEHGSSEPVVALGLEVLHQRMGGSGQREQDLAAVGGVGFTVQEAVVDQLADGAGHRLRGDAPAAASSLRVAGPCR